MDRNVKKHPPSKDYLHALTKVNLNVSWILSFTESCASACVPARALSSADYHSITVMILCYRDWLQRSVKGRLHGELMLRLGYGGDQGRAEWLMSKVTACQITDSKGQFKEASSRTSNTRYQGLGSEPQWQELIAGGIQSGQITSVNCQLKWQGQYQGHYKDQLWDYSRRSTST